MLLLVNARPVYDDVGLRDYVVSEISYRSARRVLKKRDARIEFCVVYIVAQFPNKTLNIFCLITFDYICPG